MKTDSERQFARGLLWLEDVERAALAAYELLEKDEFASLKRLNELLEMEEFARWFDDCRWKRAKQVRALVLMAMRMKTDRYLEAFGEISDRLEDALTSPGTMKNILRELQE